MPKGIPKNGTNNGRFKKGHLTWNKGKKGIQKGYWTGKKRPPMSEEQKRKIGDAHLGMKRPKETGEKISKSHLGSKNPNWKGGISNENRCIRHRIVFRLWREAVFARDNWTCQKTGIRGEKLHPHHILNFSEYPELRFDINNGITLSVKAHQEFHKKYGIRHNTREQLEEFLGKKI